METDMQDLYNAAYRAYHSLVATQPKLMDTFSLPLWAADEYHADFAVRQAQHDAALRHATYRMRLLDNLTIAHVVANNSDRYTSPDFATLLERVRGYDDTYLDF